MFEFNNEKKKKNRKTTVIKRFDILLVYNFCNKYLKTRPRFRGVTRPKVLAKYEFLDDYILRTSKHKIA